MILKAPVWTARESSRPESDALRFDRRREARQAAEGRVMVSFRDQHGQAGLTWMQVADTSRTGLGLESPIPVPAGAVVFLHSGVAGRRMNLVMGQSQARVAALAVSCPSEPSDDGTYRVGLRVNRGRAA